MQNKIIIKNENIGKRIDQFLQEQFPKFSRSYIQKLIEKNNVFLIRNKKELKNSEKTLKNGEKLRENDIICYLLENPSEINLNPINMNLDIIYENSDFAVINKPQGLVVHPCISCPDKTLVNGLIYQIDSLSEINGDFRPGIVHRLDKDTCGLILVAKNNKSHLELSRQIITRECERRYLALVERAVKEESGIISTRIGRDIKDRKKMAVLKSGGREAITEYKTLEVFDEFSLLEFSLITGRTHQIRVHSKHINHPVVGDFTYGSGKKFGLNGQFLCAYKIKINNPSTKERMIFEIDLPESFKEILNNLRKSSKNNKK